MVHGGVTKRSAFQAEGFTHQPPDPVAPDGVEPLVGDRITCAKDRVLRGFQEEETLQERSAGPAAAGKHTVKTPTAPEPSFAFHLPFVTDRQLLAAAGTTARKDLAAILRRHTRTEPMRVTAFSLVRLERALHDTLPRRT